MKRSPMPRRQEGLKRGKGIQRTQAPLKRHEQGWRPPAPPKTPIKRRTRERDNPDYRLVKRQVRERSGGVCEAGIEGVCTNRAEHVHHVIRRSQGGPDEMWNLLDLCRPCHEWVHAHPALSYENGWLRRGLDNSDE